MNPASKLTSRGFGISHVGRVRQRNEDSIYIDPWGNFALLADGMGGHRGGGEASRLTVQNFRMLLEEWFEKRNPPAEEFMKFSQQLFLDISRKIYEAGRSTPEFHDMGTTLVSWCLIDGKVHVSHVGDSKAFLLRDGALLCVTQDHNLINEQIRNGISRSEAEKVNFRHVIFRNIGSSAPCEPSQMTVQAQAGDLWLLCSDGLTNMVETQVLVDMISRQRTDLAALCQTLVECAYDRGGDDNISLIIVETVDEK